MATDPLITQRLEQLAQQGYHFSFSSIWNEGMNLWKREWLVYAGFGFVWLLAAFFAGVFAAGHIEAGHHVFTSKLKRNEPTEFGDFFQPFQNYLPLLLTPLLRGLLAFAVMMVCGFAGAAIAGVTMLAVTGGSMNASPGQALLVNAFFLIPVAFAIIWPAMVFQFGIVLVHFHQVEPWQALQASRKIVMKHFGSWFGFYIVLTLINLIGALMCYLGLLVTIPLSMCMIHAAYEQIILPVLAAPAEEDLSQHLIAPES